MIEERLILPPAFMRGVPEGKERPPWGAPQRGGLGFFDSLKRTSKGRPLFRMVTRTSSASAYDPTDRIRKPKESPTA